MQRQNKIRLNTYVIVHLLKTPKVDPEENTLFQKYRHNFQAQRRLSPVPSRPADRHSRRHCVERTPRLLGVGPPPAPLADIHSNILSKIREGVGGLEVSPWLRGRGPRENLRCGKTFPLAPLAPRLFITIRGWFPLALVGPAFFCALFSSFFGVWIPHESGWLRVIIHRELKEKFDPFTYIAAMVHRGGGEFQAVKIRM